MLLQFNFNNYKSFVDENSLDMTASGISEYKSHLIESLNENVLPIAAIYGANASGKSNVIGAFDNFRCVATGMFSRNVLYDLFWPLTFELETNPHFLSDSKASFFEVYFILEKTYYNYGIEVEENRIKSEFLYYNTKTNVKNGEDFKKIFERKNNKLEIKNKIKGYEDNIVKSISSNTSLINLGKILNIEILSKIYGFINDIKVIDFSTALIDKRLAEEIANDISENKINKAELMGFINSFESSINDVEIYLEEYGLDKKRTKIKTIHQDKNGRKFELSIDNESTGTKKMIGLFKLILEALNSGSILFFDELDIKIHPLLMRNIINLFTNKEKNKKGAQLIFTTHNTVYMDMKLFRRDEVWFVEKENQISKLYSLDDVVDRKGDKIRKDCDFEKNYLLGKFGGIPNLKNFGV